MRILKLRLQNLNSLSGEWEIDFTHPDYINEGLFAITGPTGAGKTTILDAMCLALYGQTPRLGKITKSENDIMARHHGECLAQITFATEEGEYLVRWSQRRARGAANGALQHPQHVLSAARTGDILEEKVSKVAPKVEALTGLDFNRFTRSMMLAQGAFAAFLNADEGERSALLEQITGSEIYAQLSVLAFQRLKSEKENLVRIQNQLGDIKVMTDEERSALVAQRNHQSSEIIATEKAREVCQEADLWVKKLADLQQKKESLGTRIEQLKNEQLLFSQRRPALDNDRKARPYENDLSQYAYFQREHTKIAQRRDNLKTQLPALKKEHNEAVRAQSLIADELSARNQLWLNKQGDLKQAQRLDKQLGELQVERKNLIEQITLHSDQQKKMGRELESIKDNEQNQRAKLAELNASASDSPARGELANWLPLLERDLNELEETQQQIQRSQKKALQLTEQLKELTNQLQLETQQRTSEALQHQLNDRTRQLKQIDLAIEDLRLQQHFNTQRHLLKPGHACPLCGAEEHAVDTLGTEAEVGTELANKEAARTDMESQLERTRTELVDLNLQAAVSSAEQKSGLAQLDAEIRAQNQQIENFQQQNSNRLLNWQNKAGVLGIQADNLNQLHTAVQQHKRAYERQQAEINELQQSQQQLVAKKEHLELKAEEHRQQAGGLSEKQAKLDSKYKQCSSERQQLLDGEPTDQLRNRLQAQISEAQDKMQLGNENLHKTERKLTTQQVQLDELSNQAEHYLKNLNEFQDKLIQAARALNLNEIEQLQAYLLPTQEREELEQAAENIRQQQLNIEYEKSELEKSLAEAQANQPEDAQGNALQLKALNEQLGQQHRALGVLEQQLEQDKLLQEQYKSFLKEVETYKAVYRRWATLDALIGSADGKKYRNFAQGLTFAVMIRYANEKLRKMSERYVLVRDSEAPLKLNVVDDYQAGEIRSTRNLSGGESFIVSLALALGLAQMASSRVRVDSLFLDEGFGTLDDDALDTALNTLASLRQDGKMIGLISHVGSLKERIPTQLQVVAGAAGRSRLIGPGVKCLSKNES